MIAYLRVPKAKTEYGNSVFLFVPFFFFLAFKECFSQIISVYRLSLAMYGGTGVEHEAQRSVDISHAHIVPSRRAND